MRSMFTGLAVRQLLLWGLCVWTGAAIAQGTPGGIAGKLIDPDGNPVTEAGVTGLDQIAVLLKDATRGATYSGNIDRGGNFSVVSVPAGTYDIEVPITGTVYAPYAQKGVAIKAGETLRIDFHVDWGVNLGTIGDDPVKLGADMRARTKDPTAPAPRTPDGKPDLSGIWTIVTNQNIDRPPVSMKPWAAEKQKNLPKEKVGGDCIRPRSINLQVSSYPFKFIQTPTIIVQLSEFALPAYRQIFMDGRKHPDPDNWNPAFLGHSIGYWDGDTLVVDTVGYHESAPAFRASVHSEQLHTVERYHRINKGTMAVEIWAEDPEAWTAPYEFKYSTGLAESAELLEYVCE